ncbi:unnamed protein product [Aphanomyces euteiches]|uniref:EF-hand domain-containing protein n=1 Tax=Aphanomyces euteiches TaxID=100861 RepID=A0A6G0XE13_9STRA|nr:hypothetical protein Ae201684_005671 [Aphanomyces euteiches]KAH9078403.1 hypothetical protein Ae201684P_019492 [Aphanomyces euteiches]KAH9144392.1 hypothetical protein AeRB84_011654 [Aphanomyces euteiches]
MDQAYTSLSSPRSRHVQPRRLPTLQVVSSPDDLSSTTADTSDQALLGKLHMDMAQEPPKSSATYLADFKFNMDLAVRAGIGTVLAALLMTKAEANNTSTASQPRMWFFFPDWYVFGGLSVVAMATVFGAGNNIGFTVREIFQQLGGVGSALLFNVVVFLALPPQSFQSSAELEAAKADGTLVAIQHSFSGAAYWMHPRDFYTKLPFLMLFTVIGMLLPMEVNTRRYMLNNNLYFALTLASPNDFTNPNVLKSPGDPNYATSNMLANLLVYFMLGVLGAFLASVMLWFPKPILAMRQLETHTQSCAATLNELLHLLVDAYCFQDLTHLHFIKGKLAQKFAQADAKHAAMQALLGDVWWEQLVGLPWLVGFSKVAIDPFVELYMKQLETLRGMDQALQLQRNVAVHTTSMLSLQHEIYKVSMHVSNAMTNISTEIHRGAPYLSGESMEKLQHRLDDLTHQFHVTRRRVVQAKSVEQVQGSLPLHLFHFALDAYCSNLMAFPAIYNAKAKHSMLHRIRHFTRAMLFSYVDLANYPVAKLQTVAKACVAVLAACFISVYTFAYSSTTPSAVAIIMSNHVGGSFHVTANRVAGIIAGTIVPSVCLFYICSYLCDFPIAMALVTYVILFSWVTMSMYVNFKNGIDWYAGLISAFTSTQVLLQGCSGCHHGATTPFSSYANLAQLSVGVVLFIVVELLFWPRSVTNLVRLNVQTFVQSSQTCLKQQLESASSPSALPIAPHDLKALLTTQNGLLAIAPFEPTLWRRPFSAHKYKAVQTCCSKLYEILVVVGQIDAAKHAMLSRCRSKLPREVNETLHAIQDTLETLYDVFDPSFADSDRSALYLEMKEAFRVADKDGSGQLDAAEVKSMLERILHQSGATTLLPEDLTTYVDDFMRLVDQDQSGSISQIEFANALDRGLLLRIELTQQKRQKRMQRQSVVPSSSSSADTSRRRSSVEPPTILVGGQDLVALDDLLCSLIETIPSLQRQFSQSVVDHAASFDDDEGWIAWSCVVCALSAFAETLVSLEACTLMD